MYNVSHSVYVDCNLSSKFWPHIPDVHAKLLIVLFWMKWKLCFWRTFGREVTSGWSEIWWQTGRACCFVLIKHGINWFPFCVFYLLGLLVEGLRETWRKLNGSLSSSICGLWDCGSVLSSWRCVNYFLMLFIFHFFLVIYLFFIY